MALKDFMPTSDAKITVEKAVKPKPKTEELTIIEKSGKPILASEMEESSKPFKRRKTSSKKSVSEKISKIEPKRDSILIITEKPQAALKISSALGNARKYSENNVPFYELERSGNKIIVASAVGHLFSLTYVKGQTGWPIFKTEWIPSYNQKTATFTRNYYNLLKKLSKRAKEVIIATDYDNEGEVIGWNVLRFIIGKENAKRMKYSTLTKPELEKSYENAMPHLDWGQAYAGETRHEVDWLYGINLSRALMSAIKKSGSFKILSIGRVQGPALKVIVDRELEIENFKPEPYWQVFAISNNAEFKHTKDLFDKNELKYFEDIKEGQATTKKTEERHLPLPPFDLTTLQREAYRLFKLSPSDTLKTAQSLYLDGIISYPRTSSQKIPEQIEPKKILKELAKRFPEVKYSTRDKPVEGAKSDPAHPSIYPTGEFKNLEGDAKKLYELIVKRFISCFSPDAITTNKRVKITAKEKDFTSSALEIKEKGWLNIYPIKMEESSLPDLYGLVKIDKIRFDEKLTQAPKRYTPASLISILEKKNLGTKCLVSDTKVISNGNIIPIKELFDSALKFKKEENKEIRKIEIKTTSLDENNQIKISPVSLISKRKLSNDEEIIKIQTPLSEIAATKEHVFYTYNNSIKKKLLKEINNKDNLIALTEDYREGEIIFTKEEMGRNYKEKDGNIVNRLGASIKGIKKSVFPIRWSVSLAWILGYYYGNGSYSNPKYNGSHQFYFTTTETKALELLKRNIKNVFGNEPYCYDLGGKYKVSCNSAISAVLIKLFPNIEGKHPIDIPREFIGDFLRGFFDADGNVHLRPKGKTRIKGTECNSFGTPRIKMTLASEELINWISSLLKKLGIDNNVSKGKSKCLGKTFICWTILIGGKEKVEKYAIKVGFDSYKEDILYKGLRCNSLDYKTLQSSGKIYFILKRGEFTSNEIAKLIRSNRVNIINCIKHLSKLISISKRRIGNNVKQRWVYTIKDENLDLDRYYTKLLFEKIYKNIYAIPIENISKEKYEGDVYDLSVSKDSPNFIISGNILVHNSTRSSIVDTLFDRGYLEGASIKATPLGKKLIDSLEKYSPIIIDESLTKELEEKVDEIQNSNSEFKEKKEKIIENVERLITDISKEFKAHEREIGQKLMEGTQELREMQKENSIIMPCPICKQGHLAIKYSKKNRRQFIACDRYPECTATYSLPPNGFVKKTEKVSEEGLPILISLKKGKRPWEFKFDPNWKANQDKENQNK